MVSIRTQSASRKKKVFVDSSVLMAAAISPTGNARELINQGITQNLDLYISPDILEETERNLKKKAPHGLDYFYTFLKSARFKLHKPTKRQVLEATKLVVGKDAPIVAGAVASKADYLVSFDRKHLLQNKKELEQNFKIKVISPDELIK